MITMIMMNSFFSPDEEHDSEFHFIFIPPYLLPCLLVGLEPDHTVHLVRGSAPSAPAAAPAGTNANASRAAADTQGTGRNGSSIEGGGLGGGRFGASLFPGLGPAGLGGNAPSGLFGAGFPEFDQVQQQLTQNPNMMREIMNLPAIQNLMNNPDLMRNLIMANPQMREIIDRNPDLAHILNDPSTLRQTLEAARNPELMREMMRNTDRAMSNIESSPEGFNMLRRMYETVQEPFLNATTMGAEAGAAAGSNPFAALLGGAQNRDRATDPLATGETNNESPAPNTNPLPNPWGAPGRPELASSYFNSAADSPSLCVFFFLALTSLFLSLVLQPVGRRQPIRGRRLLRRRRGCLGSGASDSLTWSRWSTECRTRHS